MEGEVIKMASSQGIWALLTVMLIFYILKAQEKRDGKQEQRETKYQEIITSLTDKLTVVESVKKDVEEVKSYIFSRENHS